MKKSVKIATITAMAALLMASFAVADPPSSSVVTNANDSGVGSLRQIVAGADSDSTVTFANDFDIVLEGTAITIDKNLTIDGEDNDITVDANGLSRVFHIEFDYSVTLRNLTVTGGKCGEIMQGGGGILSEGTLTVEHCTVTENDLVMDSRGVQGVDRFPGRATFYRSGGGIYAIGDLTVDHSTISDISSFSYGGGLSCQGALVINDSSISGNSADQDGGGIKASSGATIANSTIQGNQSGYSGGGINSEGNVSVTNSTISGNTAESYGGGMYIDNWEGDHSAVNCTIYGNSTTSDGDGGGVAIYGGYDTISLKNCIIADNTSGTSGAKDNVFIGPYSGGSVVSQGHNLSDTSEFDAGANDLLDKNLDAQIRLDELAENGGPTKTHALLHGSLAIAGGTDEGAPTTDQRGEDRVGLTDIGAYEYQGSYADEANYPSTAGADSTSDISGGVTFVAEDGSTDLGELDIAEGGSGAASFTVERFEASCGPACPADFWWEINVTGTFTGDLTLYYDDSKLNGMEETDLKLWHYDRTVGEWNFVESMVYADENKIVASGLDQDDFSPFSVNSSAPNVISLHSFEVLYTTGGALLGWETGTEIDNAGFHIWRSDEIDGEYVRVTQNLIPAEGNEVTGASYSWLDESASGPGFFYKLEDIDYDGTGTLRKPTCRRQSLTPGWNLLDGDALAGLAPATALASVAGEFRSVWGMADGSWRMYIPDNPELSGLNTFQAGFKYFIDIVETCTLELP